MSNAPIVFFSRYEPEDYDLYRGGLLEGRARLDPHSPETVGPRPDWSWRPGRSKYFMFNLHSLRWVYDAIHPGANGDTAALAAAGEIFEDWNAKNPVRDAPNPVAWGDEHAVSWRSVTLAWFWQVWSRSALAGDGAAWKALALQHGAYVCDPTNYRAYHNHGANNALALLALGVAFADHLPEAPRWLELARTRAEQQMRDNVSEAGLHLEQSAFYHCYVLRTLLECRRVFAELDRPLGSAFDERLDRMLDTTARIAGDHAVANGFPFTNPRKDPLRVFPLLGERSVPESLRGPGAEACRRAVTTPHERSLHVDEPGGYAIFNAPSEELSIVFHTRILDMPHGQQDALGVYAAYRGRELLALPSTIDVGHGDWRPYFLGPTAHNTVQVDDLQQRPTTRLRQGAAVRVFESTKFNAVAGALGAAGPVARLRTSLGLDPLPPHGRSTSHNGTVLGSGTRDDADWVSASHDTYRGIRHRRSVVRVAGSCALVWDRVSGSGCRTRQTWHFPPTADVRLDGAAGSVALDGADGPIAARFVQLAATPAALLRGVDGDDRAGWFAMGGPEPVPCPCVRYECLGGVAEFVFVLAIGDEPLNARRAPDDAVLVTRGDHTYRIVEGDAGVEVSRD